MKLSNDLVLEKTNDVVSLIGDVLLCNMCGERYNGKTWGLDHRKFGKRYTHIFRKLISKLTKIYVSGAIDQDSFKVTLARLISYFENDRLDRDSLQEILEDLNRK